MRKMITAVIVLLAVTNIANAQSFSIGGKAGASLTKVSGQAFKDGYNLGYHVGFFAELDVNKKWGVQPELIWNQVNTEAASGTDAIFNNWQKNTSDIKLNYLTIPVLLRYNVGDLITLNLGPQFGILLNKDKSLWSNGQQAFKSGDFSLVGGATINLKTFRVYGRYVVGLNDIKDIQNSDSWKSQQLQLGVGVRL